MSLNEGVIVSLGQIQTQRTGVWRTTTTPPRAMTAAEREEQIAAQEALRRRGYTTAAEQRAAAEEVAAYQYVALQTRRAREERIKQSEELLNYRIRTTPFEIEAQRRVQQYEEEAAFHAARRNFEAALSKYPPDTRRKVMDVAKALDAYETLPGYADFTAGRRTMAQIMPGLLEEYDRRMGLAQEARGARVAEREARDERIYAEIQEERRLRAEQEAEARGAAIERRTEARRVSEARRRTAEAAQQLREDAEAARHAEIRAGMRAESAAAWEADLAAHPQRPGSPPVSAAIAEVGLQMGISPGYLDSARYSSFRSAVYSRARELSGDYYYYKRHTAGKQHYDTSRVAVSTILRAEGYIVGQAPKTEARVHVEPPPEFMPTPPLPETLPPIQIQPLPEPLPAIQTGPPGLVAQQQLPPGLTAPGLPPMI